MALSIGSPGSREVDTPTARSSLEGFLSGSVLPMKNPVLREQGVQEDVKGGEGR